MKSRMSPAGIHYLNHHGRRGTITRRTCSHAVTMVEPALYLSRHQPMT